MILLIYIEVMLAKTRVGDHGMAKIIVCSDGDRVCDHQQSVATLIKALVCQNGNKTAISLSNSDITLQLNWVKLIILAVCFVTIQQLTVINC